MSFDNHIYVGYGFHVKNTKANRRAIYDLQERIATNKVPYETHLFLDEFFQYSLFSDLCVIEYTSEEGHTPQIVFLIRSSVIDESGKLLPAIAPTKLTFPQDGSWDKGMEQITVFGTLFGLPAENTADQPDAYGWIIMNHVI